MATLEERIMWDTPQDRVNWLDRPEPGTEEPKEKKEITFSEDARRRFRSSLENFTSIFNASIEHCPDLLNHTYEGKIYPRRPVFLTLTVPRQNVSDEEIKRKALDILLQSLVKTYDVKLYIWKAEAQARGAIHFHLVIDSFVFYNKIKRLWYNGLKRLGCIPESLTYTKASHLVHMKVVKEPDRLFDELASYFDQERDDEGKLIHKHDKNKRVRDITGRNWGCSDNLKYQNFMVYNVIQELEDELYNEALKIIPIENDNGKQVAKVFVTKQCLYNKEDRSYTVTKNKTTIQSAMLLYHLYKAANIYNPQKRYYEKDGQNELYTDICESALKSHSAFLLYSPLN